MTEQDDTLELLLWQGSQRLAAQDPALHTLLEREAHRQAGVLAMVASSSIADPSVLVCGGMPTTNVSTEGYPGARYHAGCEVVDDIENLAIERAKAAFKAQYANVQPHSGTSANQVVLFSLMQAGDTILGLDLKAGGHLSHGAKASSTGNYFKPVHYGLDAAGLIDYEQVEQLAKQHRPRMIICGSSAYPRTIDFARFRQIADDVGAYLLADISHIAGLVVAGVHPSPIDHAHFTTTSTYKQLYGPRGGLILMGRDYNARMRNGKRTLAQQMQRGVFPYFQGTPNLSAIATKARALAVVQQPEFCQLAKTIVANARAIAESLVEGGYRVITGGTDNHIVLFDVTSHGLTGTIAERALESCGIVVNKNAVPDDTRPPTVASGIRLGTNSLAYRGMGLGEMRECAVLIDRVLNAIQPIDEREYSLSDEVKESVGDSVRQLCERFPIPHYPVIPEVV